MYKVELPPSCFTTEAELVVNASRIYKQEKHYIILKDSGRKIETVVVLIFLEIAVLLDHKN